MPLVTAMSSKSSHCQLRSKESINIHWTLLEQLNRVSVRGESAKLKHRHAISGHSLVSHKQTKGSSMFNYQYLRTEVQIN